MLLFGNSFCLICSTVFQYFHDVVGKLTGWRLAGCVAGGCLNGIRLRQNASEGFRVQKNALKCFRMHQNASKCFRMHQNALECFRLLQNASECIRRLQNASECFRMLQIDCISQHSRAAHTEHITTHSIQHSTQKPHTAHRTQHTSHSPQHSIRPTAQHTT